MASLALPIDALPAQRAAVGTPDAAAARLPGLTIVLPCHDEEENVAAAARAASLAGRRAALAHEIVIVDDGSTDATRELALRLAGEDSAVRVVVHERNRGYGAALRSGIAAARQPWVLLTDADGQFDLTQLEDFLPFAGDFDVIVGRRIVRQDPLGRRLAAAAWNGLVRHAFRLPVRDVDCAFKLVRRDVLSRVELTSDGAVVSTELVVGCLAAGARLKELGVRHRPRTAGRQSGTNPSVVARAFRELAKLRRRIGPLPA